jgi:Flp pilus assembly protein TadG
MVRRPTMRDDTGQAFVELALVMSVFTLLILGAAEFGQVIYASIEVANAARAGVAYGAQSPTTAADSAGMVLAALKDAPNVANMTATANPPFCSCSNATSAPVPQVSCASAPATCSANGAHAVSYVQVTTTATVTPLVHYPGISGGFTLNGQAIMRVWQ